MKIAIVGSRGYPNLGENASEWCRATGKGPTNYDICVFHAEEFEAEPHG